MFKNKNNNLKTKNIFQFRSNLKFLQEFCLKKKVLAFVNMNSTTNNIRVIDLSTEDEATLIVRRNMAPAVPIAPVQPMNVVATNAITEPTTENEPAGVDIPSSDMANASIQAANSNTEAASARSPPHSPSITIFRARRVDADGPHVLSNAEVHSLYYPQPSQYSFKLTDIPNVSSLSPRPGFECDLDLVKCPCCLDEVPRYQCYLFNCDHRVCIINGCAEGLVDARCPICRLDVRKDKEDETIKASLELENKRKREEDENLEKQIALAIAESLKTEKVHANSDSKDEDEFFIETRIFKKNKNNDVELLKVTTEPYFGPVVTRQPSSSPMTRTFHFGSGFMRASSPTSFATRSFDFGSADSFYCVTHGANRLNCTCKEPAV